MSDDEILATLKRIEDKLDKSAVLSKKQWVYTLGFSAMIASLAVARYNVWGGAVVFILGYFLMIFSGNKKL